MASFYFQTKQLAVGYHGEPVLKDITIEIPKGEILTLIGPNGVGKSTLLKSIAGQLQPIAGCVLLDREAVSGMSRCAGMSSVRGKKLTNGLWNIFEKSNRIIFLVFFDKISFRNSSNVI